MSHSFKWYLSSAAVALVILVVPHTASAANVTWDGGGGADKKMSTVANWQGDVLPTGNDTLTFDSTNTGDAQWDSNFLSTTTTATLLMDTSYTGTITMTSSSLTMKSFNLLGGTFNLSSSTVVISNNLAVTASAVSVTSTWGAGSLTCNNLTIGAGANTLPFTTTVKGNVSYTGGSIINNSAHAYTLTMSSSSAQTFTNSVASQTYRNITISNSAGVTFTGTQTPTIAGTLTIDSGSGMTIASGKTVTLSGSFTNSGTLTETGVLAKGSGATNVTDSNVTAVTSVNYVDGDRVYFSVTDEDGNDDGTATDTLPLVVTTGLGDREVVTLTETGNATELFTGSIIIRHTDSAVPGDSRLDLNGTTVVSITYSDPQDSSDSGTYSATYVGGSKKRATVYPSETTLKINNGALQTTTSSVTLTLGAKDANQMVVSFDPAFTGSIWEPIVVTKTVRLPGDYGTKVVYVKYANDGGNESSVVTSSIAYVAPGAAQPEPEIPATPAQPAAPSTPSAQEPVASVNNLTRGDLIKSSSHPAVYYFGRDAKRHAFPSEGVFNTWFSDFKNVRVVSDELLSSLPLGKNMSIRPGTRFIKLQTDPRVYAVGTDGTLHWISTEALAKQLYGKDWAKRVVDISDAFFVNYKRSTDITEPVYPNGTTVQQNGGYYFVESGMWRKFATTDLYTQHLIPSMYVVSAPASLPMKAGQVIEMLEEGVQYPVSFSAPIQ